MKNDRTEPGRVRPREGRLSKPLPPHASGAPTRRPDGFALIIVLGLLVIILGLAITFLNRITVERGASASYAANAATRQLADSAVNLVQGQIHNATSQGQGISWASQPGMIRTFDTSGPSARKAYKLYSADAMILETPTLADLTADAPPSDWADEKALFTDLNAPVTADGVTNYPILDPGAEGHVQGFSVTSPPTTGTSNPLPMPVRWLYVLEDGALVAPTGSGDSVNVAGADADTNPIIGRIAFWTDDETCKVNINTASEGTFWDTPRADSNQERTLAEYQPVQKEFQRYPGHPAMTSLAPVLFATSNTTTPQPLSDAEREALYAITPRIVGGGSEGGTVLLDKTNSALIPDSDRLYASVDELIFAPDRSSQDASAALTQAKLERARFFLTASSRAPEVTLFNTPRVAMWPIAELPPSGSPDPAFTTAFDRLIAFCSTINGKPYYFQRSDAYSTTHDITIPRNVELLSYLTTLTGHAVPGFGGDFLTKYPADRDQILTEVFDYIRSVNLQDATIPAKANRFTKPLPSVSYAHGYMPPGYGLVVPSHRGTGSNQTMGFGRNHTLAALNFLFICNAVADDPATPSVDESHGSNFAAPASPPDPSQKINAVLGGTPLATGEKYIQAMVFPELFSAMQGLVAMGPDMQMTIDGLENLTIDDGTTTQALFPVITDAAQFFPVFGYNEISRLGGFTDYRFFGMSDSGNIGQGSPARGHLPTDSAPLYPFIGTPIIISAPPTGGTMAFSGGTVTVKLYAGTSPPPLAANLIQTITIDIPPGTFPIPELVTAGTTATAGEWVENFPYNWWGFNRSGVIKPRVGYVYSSSSGTKEVGTAGRLRMLWHPTSDRTDSLTGAEGAGIFIRKDFDTVRSMVVKSGDLRMVAANPDVPDTVFVKHPLWDNTGTRVAATLSGNNQAAYPATGTDLSGQYISGATYDPLHTPLIPSNATGANSPEGTGDFDNGISGSIDGPYVNKADEGEGGTTSVEGKTRVPYFGIMRDDNLFGSVGETFFSPNRQIPSAGMLGSLPTGVKAGDPWQTLLFRPQNSHPSHSTTIPDHLLTDLFWMPVVEPYAISEPFSTAGKINMNYQIMPFNYIRRATGMAALLRSEEIMAIPTADAADYKTGAGATDFRTPVDIPETLEQFDAEFAGGDVFRSASQIMDMHLVPDGQTASGMATFWNTHALTGDNTRERPYANLLGRLTTKSNSYTVHYRVQSLKSPPTMPDGKWDESKGKITGEFRGSTLIQRYINPNDTNIPDYASAANPLAEPPLGQFYKWRVVNTRKFAP